MGHTRSREPKKKEPAGPIPEPRKKTQVLSPKKPGDSASDHSPPDIGQSVESG